MMDPAQSWFVAIWTGLIAFIATNIEPAPGVILLAVGGALLAIFYGKDRPFGRLIVAFFVGAFVGITVSQIAAELFTLRTPFARGAIAFLVALFGETMVVVGQAALKDSEFWKSISNLLPWRRK